MRWSEEQRAAKVLRDLFGDPPQGSRHGFTTWAIQVGGFMADNPEPVPEHGGRYALDDGTGHLLTGTCIGPVPRQDVWVFRIVKATGPAVYEEHGRDSIVADADLESEQ